MWLTGIKAPTNQPEKEHPRSKRRQTATEYLSLLSGTRTNSALVRTMEDMLPHISRTQPNQPEYKDFTQRRELIAGNCISVSRGRCYKKEKMPQIPWPIPSCLYGLCGRRAALNESLVWLEANSPYGLCGRKTTVNEFPSVVETSSPYGQCGHKVTLDEFPNVVETSSP